MRHFASLVFVLLALGTAPALADPGVVVRYEDEQLRVTLEGSYTGSFYRAWRATSADAPFDYLSSQLTLCTGDCFLTDDRAVPGQTYYYRFDLQAANGATVSYGPYVVTVPAVPVAVRATPNPSRALARISFTLPGSTRADAAVPAEAILVDLNGRKVRTLHAGMLARGTTSVEWDGRDETGRLLGAGIYFVRLTTPLGASTTRLVRFR